MQMKKYFATGVASLLLLAGMAIAQDNSSSAANDTSNSASTSQSTAHGDTAKVERVHGKESESEVKGRLQKAEEVLDQLTDVKESAIPDTILKGAKCVAIVPSMVKGGFVFGAEHGRGVATCRVNGRWSAPAFFTATGGSWGAQIGVEGIDLVMVFRNKEGADKLLDANFKIGGDVSAAAGPIGREASASTDIKANTAILTYSRAKGAFAGATLNGVSVRPDKDSTIAFYGHDEDFRDLLTGKVQAPAAARAFLSALHKDMRDIREGDTENASAH
jgi:lipid-binding SYLF domain-containing protein